jgi:hypothetical protein
VVVPVLRACVHSMHACMTWADMTGDASRIQYQQGLASGLIQVSQRCGLFQPVSCCFPGHVPTS